VGLLFGVQVQAALGPFFTSVYLFQASTVRKSPWCMDVGSRHFCLKLAFHVARNINDGVNKFRCFWEVASKSRLFLKVHKV
jgi:hypothetical protein